MAIQVRCPNDACGKMLSVRDEFAGKTGKCPGCGATMPIPHPAAPEVAETDEGFVAVEEVTRDDAPVTPARGVGRRDRANSGRPTPRRRYEDDEDEDDAPVLKKETRDASPTGTIVCLGLGTALLVFLAITPLFSMFSVAANADSGRPVSPSMASGALFSLMEGKIILIVSFAAAALSAAGLVIYLTATRRVRALFVSISGAFAAGWALAALFWILGFIWDVKTMSPNLQGSSSTAAGMAPGLGLWLGLGAAIGAVAVFSALFSIRGQTGWLYLGEGLGLAAGVLLFTLNVQPWVTGEPVHWRAPNFKSTKLAKRYWPLIPTPSASVR